MVGRHFGRFFIVFGRFFHKNIWSPWLCYAVYKGSVGLRRPCQKLICFPGKPDQIFRRGVSQSPLWDASLSIPKTGIFHHSCLFPLLGFSPSLTAMDLL
jgi:hypothetical protein